MKYQFKNDYSELAHPRILNALANHLNEQITPYGLDKYSKNAGEMIKNSFGVPDADVHFLAGGTQTNMVLISSALRHYEC